MVNWCNVPSCVCRQTERIFLKETGKVPIQNIRVLTLKPSDGNQNVNVVNSFTAGNFRTNIKLFWDCGWKLRNVIYAVPFSSHEITIICLNIREVCWRARQWCQLQEVSPSEENPFETNTTVPGSQHFRMPQYNSRREGNKGKILFSDQQADLDSMICSSQMQADAIPIN